MRLLVGAGVHVKTSYPDGIKRHMPSTFTGAEKTYKALTKDKNRHKNSYKSYIKQLRSTVEKADRLR